MGSSERWSFSRLTRGFILRTQIVMTEQLRRDLPLSGKNAIITGASRGLGSAIGALLRRQGASVLLVARSGDKLREAKRRIGGPEDSGTHTYEADLSDESAPNRIIEAAK